MHSTASVPQPIVNDQKLDRKPFLASHRAASACTREFTALCDSLVQGVVALHADGIHEKAIVRRSPGRCIVQLGPVAITVAWLRSTLGAVEDGELLAIVWRGAVAPPNDHVPEREPAHRASGAVTALWEQSLAPSAASEATWLWQPAGADFAGYSSLEFAERCVNRLGAAHAETRLGSDAEAAEPSVAEVPIINGYPNGRIPSNRKR